MKHKQRNERTRVHIAQEAAKIMHEQSLRDYQQAKQKACERLGISPRTALPGNDEIQQALAAYLELFKSDSQPGLLMQQRVAALEAMNFLIDFEPRLVGSVLHGTADKYAPVQLHVFAEPPELILQYLLDRGIPYKLGNRRIQYCNGRVEDISICECVAGDTPVELMMFNRLGLREAPRSPINGKPMQRMNIQEVEKLLE